MITDLDMKRTLKDLALAHNKKFTAEEYDDMTRLWKYVLKGVSPGALRSGTGKLLRNPGRFFPKPGELLAAINEGRSPDEWGPTEDKPGLGDSPCPVCGEELRLLTSEEQDPEGIYRSSPSWTDAQRYGICHNRAKHQAAEKPIIGGSWY